MESIELGKFEQLGTQLGQLLDEKDRHYGNAYETSGKFLELLYPNGMQPSDYIHALTLIRMFDKMTRIASPNRDLDSENPYEDLAGYGILGQQNWVNERKRKLDRLYD